MKQLLKKYRWFAVGALVVAVLLGGAVQTGYVSADFGGMASLAVVSSLPAPSGLNAAFGTQEEQNGFVIHWTDNSTNEDAFSVESRKPFRNAFGWESPGTWSKIGTSPAGAPTYRVKSETISDESTYCFRVQAINRAGSSAYSNEACGVTRPHSPTNLKVQPTGTVNSFGDPVVNVTWTDNSRIETAYDWWFWFPNGYPSPVYLPPDTTLRTINVDPARIGCIKILASGKGYS